MSEAQNKFSQPCALVYHVTYAAHCVRQERNKAPSMCNKNPPVSYYINGDEDKLKPMPRGDASKTVRL